MLSDGRPRLFLEGPLLVFAVAASAAPVAILPAISPILATFGAEIPPSTRLLLASGPFFAGQAAAAAALLLLWVAERLAWDAGLASRLRGAIPGGIRERRVLASASIFGVLCLELLFCVYAAMAPQFQGSLASP